MNESRRLRLVASLALASLIGLAASVSAQSNITYKCKGSDGKWAAENCPGFAAQKLGETAKAQADDAATKERLRLRDAWYGMCRADYDCINRHEDDYQHMRIVLGTAEKGSVSYGKAMKCFTNWFVESVDSVDATMWRYCYYAP